MSDYNTTLAATAGLLGLKMALTHWLTVRSRLILGKYLAKEDRARGVIGQAFKVLMGAFGPALDIERLTAVVRNSVENEPYLLLMALFLGQTGQANAHDATMLKAYAALRLLHAVCYVAAIQPFRALSFVGGLSVNVCFGARLALLLL